MQSKPPIHHRDFSLHRTQVTLAELPGDAAGLVHLCCGRCPRTDAIPLARLRAEFAPGAGLVNILNAIRPGNCAFAGVDFQGFNRCGYRYRDLGARSGG